MGDEVFNLPNPLGDDLSPMSVLPLDEVQLMAELGQTVNDCTELVASLEDSVESDIQACVNNCHGDIGLCQACIEGEINSHVERAGFNVKSCGDRLIKQITEVTGEAWVRAFELGIPPATQVQLAAAINGEEIPDDGTFTAVRGSDDGPEVIIDPPVILPPNGVIETVPVPPPSPQPPPTISARNLPFGPDGQECIPYQWSDTAINNWAAAFLSGENGSFIFRQPTETETGVWQTPTTVYSIPRKCPRPAGTLDPQPTPPEPTPTPVPPGGQIITIPTPVPTPTPPQTIITIPSPPPAPGQTCPTPNITVNVPPCPTQRIETRPTPDQTCPTLPRPKCLVCLGDGTTAIMDYADERLASLPPGSRILGCGLDDRSLSELAQQCGVAPPVVIEPPPQQPITIPAPSPPGGNICSPETIQVAAGLADNFLLTAQGSADSVADSVGAIVGAILIGGLGKLTGLNDIPIIGPALGSLAGAIGGSFSGSVIRNVVQPSGADPNCSSDAFFIAAIGAATAKLFGNWFGTVPRQTSLGWTYKLNYMCPNQLPTAPELNALSVRGYVQPEPWESAVKMNGLCPEWQKVIVDSLHTRIGIQDAYRLFKLGKITGEDFVKAWKRQGIDTDKELQLFQDSVIQYPGMADLVRMMVRDVGDPKAVEFLGLDDGFNDKWRDSPQVPLQSWGTAQGISDEVAKAFWRAHWQAPSPTIIYEWLHRLRPDDRPDDDPNAGLTFTKEQAAEALRIADYVPAFIDQYLAVSYRPLTRVDIRRMWEVGTFDSLDQVRQSYRDIGYDDRNARFLADFTEKSSAAAKAKLAGALSATEVSNAYKQDLLREEEARTLLVRAGLNETQVNQTIEAANARRTTNNRKIIVESLRQRFFMGEFTDQEARDQLTQAFMSVDQAEAVVNMWLARRAAKRKEPTVSMLCKWYGNGMITLENYLQRVRNLRYSEIDALRIVETCNMDIQKRRQEEIEKALKQAAKESQARNREAARLLREANAQARAMKLLRRTRHKEQITDRDGIITSTITDTITETPDVNVTVISENVDIRTNGDV